MPADAVLDDLVKVADDRVREARSDDAIDGRPSRYVATPASTEETAELLRVAARHGLHVITRGSGTKQRWGNSPGQVDLVVETTAIAGVVEHAAGDLITVVRAGTTMSDLQAALAVANQQLALDTPIPSATVGGTVATDTSGPRRLLYGTMRDLLIGITFVRADGVVARAGGKVVKNVAGYDFGKLLTGSYGTLGIITEVALRLHPVPATQRMVTMQDDDADAAARAARRVLGSQVVPAAVEVDQPVDGPVTVAVLLEGIEAGVGARTAATRALLGAGSTVVETPGWFGKYPFGIDDVGLKITTTLVGVGPVLMTVRDAGRKHGVPVAVRGSAGGVLYASMPSDTRSEVVASVLGEIRTIAAAYDGTVVVLTAPAETRRGLDVWGPVGGLDLMRRLKDQLDPDHRLSPGRFVGGI
jgi:glycolate oxidase FAD binding subunit